MAKRNLKILALEPYYGGSHARVLENLARLSEHEFTVLSMPARKWKWRMRGAALEMARRAEDLDDAFDVVFASDMLSVADWKAIAPRGLREAPTVTYFHENQLTYPLPDESERDYQYGFTNITTCFASDAVWFNSDFHRGEFLSGARSLLERMPDFVPGGLVEEIAARARVVYPGVEGPSDIEAERAAPYTVLWNHRWEWDKNPEEFFEAVTSLHRRGVRFCLAVAGETSPRNPDAFESIRSRLSAVIVNWGFLESPAEYRDLLSRCDIVVSTARHEFFGLSVLEAVAAGCGPVLPRRLSYPEVFDEADERVFFFEEGRLEERLAEILTSQLPARAQVRGLAERFLWPAVVRLWDEGFRAAANPGR
ncbi:MAG: tRNA-queuosine alpha-mannosyltransferase domain-containing protein [Planctomycetota bacterium]|jgi:glycosyltransferase involved in cell wall biosynthesis